MTEMNASMDYLRLYLNGLRERAKTTRVFFPDDRELAVARQGQTEDPGAGRKAFDAKFDQTPFRLGCVVGCVVTIAAPSI